MEEDNKTVTMPLSEYRRMEEAISNMKLQNEISQSERSEYENKISELEKMTEHLRHSYIDVLVERCGFRDEISNLKEEIANLEEELSKYKEKKWYQFWK